MSLFIREKTKITRAGLMILVTLVCMICGVVSLQAKEPLTLEDLARLQYIGEIAVSPDGEHFAYTLTVQRNPFQEEDGSAWKHLYLVDTKGQRRPYVTGEVKISEVGWTPDGKRISYLAERGKDTVKALYTIPLQGGESRRHIQMTSSIKEYAWSPDSRTITFLAKDSLSRTTRELRKKGFDQEIYEEDWRHVRVWIYDTEDSTAGPRALDLPGTASNIKWSPDGKLLALTLAPTPSIDDYYMARKVCMIDPISGEIVHKFDNPGKLGQIAWSPDSKKLAIITGSDINDPEEGEVVVGRVDNGEMFPVITNFDGHVRELDWLDNGTIIYRAVQGVETPIGIVKLDGLKRQEIVKPGGPAFEDMVISANRKTVGIVGSGYDYPWELFYFRVGENSPTRLTQSNPWLANVDFGPQEVITYKARDGLELQGMLMHPVNEEPGKRYPLILSVHGGPEANHSNGWLTWYSSPGQVAAGRGFAVFYPNYRGSTGRGVEFSKMGQADYAGGEFDDLVDAVDHLVSVGLVDSTRVGITGGSYGGYATAWGSTALSEHFAAGVMRVGVSDLVSKFGTTDIPNEMFLVHARRWPWDHWQWYMERSPIFHAQNHKTPLLIMHGEDDTRVHPSQSMELYRYLKTLGQAPVRLVFYQDEGHGTTKAAARYDTGLRLLRWMEHYLMGPGGDPPPYEMDYSRMATEAASDN